MDRAAEAVAAEARRMLGSLVGPTSATILTKGRGCARVVSLVGTGNNGGDALLAGARLARRGVGHCHPDGADGPPGGLNGSARPGVRSFR